MTAITLGQAIRNAIGTELAAEHFYRRLAARTTDPRAHAFLTAMADEERDHAAALEHLGWLSCGVLPEEADALVLSVETAPGWSDHEGMSLDEALRVALEAEHHAVITYDALAGSATGEVAEFFRQLVHTEEAHAERLRATLAGRAP